MNSAEDAKTDGDVTAAEDGQDRPEHFTVRLLSALYLATFCIRTSFGMFIVAFPEYTAQDEFTLGIIWAASPLFELLSVLWVGAIIDRYGRKMILVYGLVLGMLAMVALAFTRDPYAIFVINGFHGISSGCIIVSSLALMADYVKPENRGKAIGVFDGVNIFGWATGFILGGACMQAFHENLGMVFIAAGVVALIGAVYGWFNISEPDTGSILVKQMKFAHLVSVLRQRSFLYLVLTWFVVYVLIGSLMAHSPTAGTEGLGLSRLAMGLLMGGVCIAILGTQLAFGNLSDRYGRTPIMIVGVVGIIGAMAIGGIGVLSAENLTFAGLLPVLKPWLPLICVFLIAAMAFPPAALAAMADDAQEKKRGLTMGVFAMAMAGGMMVGPPGMGYVSKNFGSKGVFLFVLGVLAALTFFVVLRVRAQRRGE